MNNSTVDVITTTIEITKSESSINNELVDMGSNTHDDCDDVDEELDDLQLHYSQIGIDDELNTIAELTELASFNPYQIEIPNNLFGVKNPVKNYYEQQIERDRKETDLKELSKFSEKIIELFESVNLNSEIWLQQCEKLFLSSQNLIESFIEIKLKSENSFIKIIDQLIEISFDLINYKSLVKSSKLNDQTKQMFKIHQIKLGLTLTTLLVTSFDEDTSKKLIINKQIQSKLVQLLEHETIYISIKTLILKTIDSTLHYPSGIKEFLYLNNNQLGEHEAKSTTKSAYTRLLLILISKKSTSIRLNSQIGKILNKLSFYNLLSEFEKKVKNLVSLNNDIKLATNLAIDQFTVEQYKLVNELNDLFTLISYMWKNLHKQIGQNENIIKKLPIKLLFVNQMLTSEQEEYMIKRLSSSNDDDLCLLFYYRIISHFKLIKSVIILWSHPILTQIRVDFLQLIEKFFNDMTFSSESLNYLLLNSKQTTILAKLMLKKPHQTTTPTTQNSIDDLTTINNLTSQFVYSLQTSIYISSLNQIYSTSSTQSKFDFYLQLLNQIQSLCIFLNNLHTKLALVNVFTLNKNIEILINLLKLVNNQSDDSNENEIKKLLISSIIELIHSIFKHNDNNINFFKNYSKLFDQVISLYRSSSTQVLVVEPEEEAGTKPKFFCLKSPALQEKLKQIDEYLKPHLKLKSYSYECIGYLIKNLKQFTATLNFNSILTSKVLVQILRILKYLCVAPSGENESNTMIDSQKYELLSEFNYKRCLGELLSQQNFLNELFYIIKKLSNYILYTFQNCITLSLSEKQQIHTVLKLTLILVLTILRTQISVRQNKFNNTECLSVFFNLYNSMYLSDQLNEEETQIKTLILNIFTLYMNQNMTMNDDGDGDDDTESLVYNNNLYKCLFRELCKFIIDSPSNYIGGLIIFTDLLPLPLPIICKYSLNDDKILNTIRNERLVLDFNLNLILAELRVVLRILSSTANLQLQQALKKFCIHFADISSNLCSFVLKSILNFIIEFIEQECGKSVSIEVENSFIWPLEVSRLFTFISSLVGNSTNSSLKYGLLYLIKPQKQTQDLSNANDKYRLLIINSINYCLNSHHQLLFEYQNLSIQESIFYLIQFLCDNNTIYDEHSNIFSQLPDYELLNLIVKLLIDHLKNTKLQSLQITMSVLQALAQLCRHDYGFELVISELTQHTSTIYNFINEFNSTILNIRQQQNLYDLLSLLTDFYEFIRLLVPSPTTVSSTESEENKRKSCITSKKFKELIKWNINPKDHPLLNLRILLESYLPKINQNDETANVQMNELYNHANSLIGFLRKTDLNNQINENEKLLFLINDYKFSNELLIDELNYGEREMLDNYYKKRLIYIEDDNINSYDDIERYINEWASISGNNYDGSYDDDLQTASSNSNNSSSNINQLPQISDYSSSTNMEPMTTMAANEIDLDDIIKNYCHNFDLNSELNKEFGDIVANKQNKAKKPEFINTRTGFRYKAPMRGGHSHVGGMRGSLSYMMMNRSDPFRSRQPNTSRPPSVHVDDFYRIQAQDAATLNQINIMNNTCETGDQQYDEWQRQQQQQSLLNRNNGQTSPSLNARSRYLMPPGTYSSKFLKSNF